MTVETSSLESYQYVNEYSPYGGVPLESTSADPTAVALLAELGITDVEQVLALAAMADTRDYLAEALRERGTDAGELIARLREEAPAQMAMVEAAAPVGPVPTGALPPTAEIEAMIASQAMPMSAEFAPAALPPSVNHIAKMPPIRNQGSRGTCTAFAMTAVHEFHSKASGSPQDYSEQFLYDRTKAIDGNPAICGSWQVKAATILNGQGQCREAVWPYNGFPPCNNNGAIPANAPADAAQFKLPTIVLQPKDVNAIKAALAGGVVVGFSIPCYDSWRLNPSTRQTGRITLRLGNEPVNGGHAMCLVGYQDDASAPGGGFFILRNSWDVTWGSQCPFGPGHGTIPYAYIAADCWEAVTTPKPVMRPRPWDRWRPRDRVIRPIGEGDELAEDGGRPTIVIDTGGVYDIVIR